MELLAAGYSNELWVPEGGWDYDEDEASIDPFPLQLEAAYQCFLRFFVDNLAWVHLAAEMQAGKTGVMAALIRLILRNQQRLRFRASRIFTITGMSENSWRDQTKKRLPRQLRENVYHNSSLNELHRKLQTIHEREGLRNVLILVDESHIASAKDNRPDKLVYDTIRRYVPDSEWAAHNIRFLTISATDPAKVMSLDKNQDAVVQLKTTDAYQSVEKLKVTLRIHATDETLGDLPSETAIAELKARVATYETPCYHLVRPKQGKVDECVEKLEREFPGAVVRKWDAETVRKQQREAESASSSGPDINSELLDVEPLAHTFIVLKDMFRAAKTMNDRFVGVLWDRITGKDDTTMQGLLGRVCGYGKNPNTHIYCSGESVDNYIRVWRRLCSDHRSERTLEGISMRAAMTGVEVKPTQGGNTCVYTSPNQSMPVLRDPAWEPATQSAYEVSPESFATVKIAKEWALENTPHTGATAYGLYAADGKTRGKTHIVYRGEPREIKSETDTRRSSDLGGGLSAAYARVMPVLDGETIRYIVIYRP